MEQTPIVPEFAEGLARFCRISRRRQLSRRQPCSGDSQLVIDRLSRRLRRKHEEPEDLEVHEVFLFLSFVSEQRLEMATHHE